MRVLKARSPILLSIVASFTLLWIIRNVIPGEAIKADIETWGVFFTVFGIIYAILVGFLLVEVLRRFHSLSSTIQEELNAVEDIRDFLVYIDENTESKREIRKALIGYVNSVIEREWINMEHSPEAIDSDTSPELYQLMEAVHKIRVTNESDCVALDAIINKIADMTTQRTTRLELSSEHLSPTLRFLIIFLSVILVVGFLLLGVESVWVHGLMTFSVVIATHLLYMVISDLNHPFWGIWNIKVTPFKRLAQRLPMKE